MPHNLNLPYDVIDRLSNKYGTPFYIYDENGIIRNATNFMNTFKKYIPSFKQYFAVKALPNTSIMKILKDCGMGFDCSSVTEINLVNMLETKSDIIYSSNYTSTDDLATMLNEMKENPDIILNLDDIDGLENLMFVCNNLNYKIPEIISFRLNPLLGNTNSETKSNILGGTDTKFGIPSTKIINAYKLAKNIGIKKFGIHVMAGSCVMDIQYWKQLIDILFVSIADIYKNVGITFDFIDLGGGIGIPYHPDTPEINIDDLAKLISDSLNYNTKKYNISLPTICMENGRYITGPYGWLVSRCKSIKIGYNDVKYYGLDACMSNLMRPGMYESYHHITIPRIIDHTEQEEVNIVGTLCENNDWFAKKRLLSTDIKKNDIFIIHDVGAHGHCMGFQYNGKLRSAEFLMNGTTFDDIKMIRRKEEFDDIFRTET